MTTNGRVYTYIFVRIGLEKYYKFVQHITLIRLFVNTTKIETFLRIKPECTQHASLSFSLSCVYA